MIAGSSALVFVIDLFLPLGVAGGVPYLIVVFLGYWLPRRRYVFVLAAWSTVLTIIGIYVSPIGDVTWVVLANRALAFFAIWATAFLVAYLRQTIHVHLKNEGIYRVLAAASPSGIFRTDPTGLTTYVNEKYCELGNVTSEDAMGLGWIKAIHPDDVAETTERWRQFCGSNGDESFLQEQRYVQKDGVVRICLAEAIAEKDEEGRVLGFVGSVTDITDQKEKEQALVEVQKQLRLYVTGLEEAQGRIEEEVENQRAMAGDLAISRDEAEAASKSKSEFLAAMSHEIRTPMTGVMGFADLLLDDDLSVESRDKVYKIKDATRSLLRIINDILDMSKMEAGKMAFEYIDFHLPSVISDAVALFGEKRESERASNLDITVNLSDDFPTGVHGDSIRIRQILVNLIGNAVKFAEECSVVVEGTCLSVGEQKFIKIAIHDTGIGIQPETMGKLFSDFSQADASITRRFEGTGLGLSICKRLTEVMGGEIGVESEYGEGSTFWFTRPYIPAASDVSAQSGELLSSTQVYTAAQPLHLLIVDDNKLNQQIIYATMIRFGHTAKVVENGIEAISAHEENGYDLILMDVRMPLMSGPEATRHIRQMNGNKAGIPIIALTADVMAEHRKGYYEAGMNSIVTKPIDLVELALSINAVMGQEIHVAVGVEEVTPTSAEQTSKNEQHEEKLTALVDDFLKQIEAVTADDNA